MGVMALADVQGLWNYSKATGARSVKFGTWPSNVSRGAAPCR